MFLASEPASFSVGLVDTGDGFDWRAADLSRSVWLEDSVSLRVEGKSVAPVEVECWAGRVSFGRSVSGSAVSASGECLPVALETRCASWTLTTTLEGVGGDLVCEDCELPEEGVELFVALSLGAGAIRGFGSVVTGTGAPPRIELKGGLRYGSGIRTEGANGDAGDRPGGGSVRERVSVA